MPGTDEVDIDAAEIDDTGPVVRPALAPAERRRRVEKLRELREREGLPALSTYCDRVLTP